MRKVLVRAALAFAVGLGIIAVPTAAHAADTIRCGSSVNNGPITFSVCVEIYRGKEYSTLSMHNNSSSSVGFNVSITSYSNGAGLFCFEGLGWTIQGYGSRNYACNSRTAYAGSSYYTRGTVKYGVWTYPATSPTVVA